MSTLNDEDRANLAAYLDGELDEESTQALEAKLNRDPEARKEVETLRQAWSMLDYLPRPEPSPNFTHRTLERLSLANQTPTTAKMGPVTSTRWWVKPIWAGLLVLTVALGAWAGQFLWCSDQDEALAQHQRAIDNFRLLEPLEDVDFLRALDQPDLFGEESSSGNEPAGPEEADWNRNRKNPEYLAQLKREAQAFLALPAERREHILQLDQDLAKENPAARDRLLGIARRYRDWLERLDDKDKLRVTEALDKNTRLDILQELREQEWLSLQPKAQREQAHALQGQDRVDFLKKIRQEERQRHHDWQVAARFWNELSNKNFQPPVRMADLPREVQDYITEYLKPMLGKEEKERLTRSENKWPEFPQTLVELADRHPPALPGTDGPKYMNELPAEVLRRIKIKLGSPKAMKIPEGRWPNFAISLSDHAFRKGIILPHELWPTHDKCLSLPMQDFFNNQLQPVLTPDEIRQLGQAHGKWPDFPQNIQELARNHNLQPPWFTLPGPQGRWDNYRQKASE